jgi:cytochrome c oxidase subunit 3
MIFKVFNYNLVVVNFKVFSEKHSYHLVDESPWPLIGALSGSMVTFGGVMSMHGYIGGPVLLKCGFCLLILTMYGWWKDLVREGTFEGQHTKNVQDGLKLGMILFIVSEIMFFAAFFWGFFHSALVPAIELGNVWPPIYYNVLNAWEIPFLNTIILLSSGATVTWAHYGIIKSNYKQSILGLLLTIFLAVFFTILQGYEYLDAPFTISDSVYGSTFFMATGFHGFHVFVGTCFLSVCLGRLCYHHFTTNHHLGFEAAAWYWHFVDVVWLFLFIMIYWWGGN